MAQELVEIEVVNCDILEHVSDVLVLKYADQFYGADATVSNEIDLGGSFFQKISDGGYALRPSGGKIGASRVLYVEVPELHNFHYGAIREFARKSLSILAQEAQGIAHVAATIHGVGYGLDEAEAFKSEIAGFVDAICDESAPPHLKKISIVERNYSRYERLTNILAKIQPLKIFSEAILGAQKDSPGVNWNKETFKSVGVPSEAKPHIFVAMPFNEEFDDIFHYGISAAVRQAGFLCERMDQVAFTGDVLERMRKLISTAEYVVADLSKPNANVYLEVGYAWGCNVPTILLAKDVNALQFDVRGQRCLLYKNIRDLEECLLDELSNLSS